jgi:DNA-binding response OmpR family regulator
LNSILLIDDDPELSELLGEYLQEEGYLLHTEFSATAGMERFNSGTYDLLILDIMLPDINGLNVLNTIRQTSRVPIIMLTGRGEEVDRVVGLEMGADDYISKPFPLRELLARIRAVLRRYDTAQGSGESVVRNVRGSLELGEVLINRDARSVTVGEREVHLTSAEFGILEQLAVNQGVIVEREQLMQIALGKAESYDDYVLNVHMSNLRKKVGASLSIKTIRGRGYVLTPAASG